MVCRSLRQAQFLVNWWKCSGIAREQVLRQTVAIDLQVVTVT